MTTFIEYLAMMVFVIMFYQFYAFAVSRKGEEKQHNCQRLGIFYISIGTTLLVFRHATSVFTGLILIMMGLRLIAHGLDRVDKKIYIDHYADDDTEP